jgi:hypothetical protein
MSFRNRKPPTVAHNGLGWRRVASADFPRQPQEVLVESWVREALIRLNPEIAAQPDRADEVLYKLRAIVLSVRSDGLIRANEEMMAWIRGERSMPFGQNNEHVPVRLIDFDYLDQNQYVVTQQFTYPCRQRRTSRRPGAGGQWPTAGADRGQDADAGGGDLGRWRLAGARRLREVRAGAVRLQRVLGGDRGQGIPLRFARPAGQGLGAVESGGRRRCAEASAEN